MKITNHEKIGRALAHVRQGLVPFIDSRLRPEDKAKWQIRPARTTKWSSADLDVKACLEILNRFWDDAFRSERLGRGERAWVNELLDKVRNPHAHPTSIDDVSDDDTWRALDTAERLLSAIGSPETEAVRLLRLSLKNESFAPTHNESLSQSREAACVDEISLQRKISGHTPSMESIYVPDLLGGLTFVSFSRGLRSIRFGRQENIDRPGPVVLKAESQVREYLDGKRASFDLPLDLQGSPFQLEVWRALIDIPYGELRSYRDIAVAVNKPNGSQAVGQANRRNPLLIVVPCHRVIAVDGSLGGWEPGVDLKRRLLDMESRSRGFQQTTDRA